MNETVAAPTLSFRGPRRSFAKMQQWRVAKENGRQYPLLKRTEDNTILSDGVAASQMGTGI